MSKPAKIVIELADPLLTQKEAEKLIARSKPGKGWLGHSILDEIRLREEARLARENEPKTKRRS